jgi:hypothetical protein
MAPRGGLPAALAFSVLATYGAPLFAQEPLGIAPPAPSPPATGGSEQAVVSRYWQLGRPRLFFATLVEAGYAYLRPKFALGYGLPYWRWVGLEAHPLLSLGGVGQYAGIAAELPRLQLRVGGRYYYPFSRSFLIPPGGVGVFSADDSFSREDIQSVAGPKAKYLALEAEAIGTLPIPAGSLFLALTGYRTMLVPDGYYMFEENLHAVMKPPYVWRTRLGYLAAFGRDAAIRVGPAVDLIGLPGRNKFVVRGGLLGTVSVNAHLAAQLSLIPVIASPDTLGVAGGDFGYLGVSLFWATDSDPDPEVLRKARAERLEQLKREQQNRGGQER